MSYLVDIQKWDCKFQIGTISTLPNGVSARSYTLTTEQSKTEDGGIELEFTLVQKPNRNYINIPLSRSNLKFYYQPSLLEELNPVDYDSLTESEAWKGGNRVIYRPPEAVGSYACYHISKQNNEYKTGKIFHLYRPKIIDANLNWVWGSYNRDADTTGILTVTVPQTFLDSAVYPVTIDPTFGYTTAGASSENQASTTKWGCQYACPEVGTLSSISAYFYVDNTGPFTMAIYDDSANTPNALLESGTVATVAETTTWNTVTGLSSALSAVNYWLTFSRSAKYAEFHYDSASTYRSRYNADALPLSDPFGAGTDRTNVRFSIYATYTAGGGGLSIPVANHHLKSMNNAHVTDHLPFQKRFPAFKPCRIC